MRYGKQTMILAAAAGFGLTAGSANAQNRPWEATNMVWTGEGTTADWNDAGNWAPQADRKLQTLFTENGNLVYVIPGTGATGGDIAFSDQSPVFDPTTLDLDRPANEGYELGDFSTGTITVTVPGNTLGISSTRSATTNDNTYDTVTFGAATNLQVNPDANRKIGHITFTTNNDNYIIGPAGGGNQLIAGNITVQGNSGTITVNSPLRHLGDVSMVPGAGRTLDINGTVTIANGRTILFSGGGTLNYDGEVVSDSSGGNFPGIRLLGTSGAQKTLNLNNENYRLNLTVDTGQTATINLNHAGAMPGTVALGTGSIFVNAENALNGEANRTVNVQGGFSTGRSAYMEINHSQSYAGNTLVGLADSNDTQGDASLWVNNPTGSGTGSGDVTVRAGILGGNGFIVNTDAKGVTLTSRLENDTSIRSYGHLSPGAAAGEIGTLTMDLGSKGLNISESVADAATASLLFDLDTVGNSDQVVLLNDTVLHIGDGGLEFDDFVFTAGDNFGLGVYTLFNTNSAISGSLGSSLFGVIGDYTGTIGFSGDGQDLILTVVPEPGTLGVLAIGAMGLMARRRRMA